MESKSNGIVLISDFGRSGQGWLSYMLCYILNARYIEPYNFLTGKIYSNSNEVVNLTSGNLSGREKTAYDLVVKTHNFPSAEFNLTNKAILLIRDPRDVAVSMHNLNIIQNKQVSWMHPRAKFFLMIYRYLGLLDYLKTIKDWRKHYKAWQKVSYHQVRYEDLLGKPKETLEGILQYLGVLIDERIIQEAIETFSFEKITGRKPGVEDKQNPEFRKGISGDYKNKFSAIDTFIINNIFKKTFKNLGYYI